MNKESLTPPETSCPIEDAVDYSITVAGHKIDTRAIHDTFAGRDDFTRQSVKDFIAKNKNNIPGLKDLEDAIKKKRGEDRAKKVMKDVYDEIIDKMVGAGTLVFPEVELSEGFELRLIQHWADRVNM